MIPLIYFGYNKNNNLSEFTYVFILMHNITKQGQKGGIGCICIAERNEGSK